MQRSIRRETRSHVETWHLTLQVRKCAARLADDYGERGDIQNIDVGFDYDVERAAREQVIVHKVAVAARAVGLFDEMAQGLPPRRAREALHVAGRNRCTRQVSDAADADPPAR